MNKIIYALLFALIGLLSLTTAESGLRLLSRTNPRASPAELVDYEAEDRRKLVHTVNVNQQHRALKSGSKDAAGAKKSGSGKSGSGKSGSGKSGKSGSGKSGSGKSVKTHGGKTINRKETKKQKNKKNSCDVRSQKEKESGSDKAGKAKSGSSGKKDSKKKSGSSGKKDSKKKSGSSGKKDSKTAKKKSGSSDKKKKGNRMRFLESGSGKSAGGKSGSGKSGSGKSAGGKSGSGKSGSGKSGSGKSKGGKSGSGKSGKKTCGEKSKKLEKPKKERSKKEKKKREKKDVDKERIPGQCVANHVCAEIRGDPHITTFDGTNYDCQGHGEFVLMKSLSSAFQVQGRFHKIKSDGPSITQGISIDEGVVGSPQLDVFAEDTGDGCVLSIYVNGALTSDFGPDGLKFPGLEYQPDVDVGADYLDYFLFSGSGIMFTTTVRKGSFGCVLDSKFCIPPAMANSEQVVGLLGSVYGPAWMTPTGGAVDMRNKGSYEASYKYCTDNWCVDKAEDSIFGYLPGTSHATYSGCNNVYNDAAEQLVTAPSEACAACCAPVVSDAAAYKACLLECVEGDTIDCELELFADAVLATAQNKCLEPIPDDPECKVDTDCVVGKNCIRGFCLVPPPVDEEEEEEDDRSGPPEDDVDKDDPTTEKAFTKGDPHFKTFGGELYDFHGECDLILVDNPDFKGVGMQIQIRTKITDWWSSVEAAAVKIGDEVLEIQANLDSTEWMWINGQANDVLEDGKWYHARLAGFLVRFKQTMTRAGEMREANIYFEGSDKAGAKDPLVLKTFKSFVHLDINWKGSENFNTATGLLGSMAHDGARLGRDGELIEDINTFGQDWQVRESDAQLFHSYEGVVLAPNMCRLPEESLAKQALRNRRLAEGMPYEEAEAACNHLVSAEEKDACIYDVLATQDKDMAGAW